MITNRARFHMSPDDQPATIPPGGIVRRQFVPHCRPGLALWLRMSAPWHPRCPGRVRVTWKEFLTTPSFTVLVSTEQTRHALLKPRSGSAITIGLGPNSIRTRCTWLATSSTAGLSCLLNIVPIGWRTCPRAARICLAPPVTIGQAPASDSQLDQLAKATSPFTE